MQKEFENNFKNHAYDHVLILVDKKKYERGELVFVACFCAGDLLDFLPPKELSYETTNFNLVPTLSKFRLYMRYKCLKGIYEKYKPERGFL
jgi:hypothetical protein